MDTASPRGAGQQDRPTVAVIGGGFSGVLTALHLLAQPQGPRVRLVERRSVFARGAAYATANPDHLLNVRVGNMSAFPDRPDHFTRWLAARDGWSAHGPFVSRGCYGDYLQSLLREAVAQGPADRLLLEPDEAVDLRPSGAGWRIRLALGREFHADAVVLAVGAPPSPAPAEADAAFLTSPRYVADPWTGAVPPSARRVLLLGTGLTMVDVALALSTPERQLTAISRRGLLSRTHQEVGAHSPAAPPPGSPTAMLHEVRRRARARDWREVVDDLRPHLVGLWRAWTLAERRRFLRHLRPWWDVHRHRLGPGVARRLEVMRRSGGLAIHAGRIDRLSLRGDGVDVLWRARGGGPRRLRVDAVVNCTGALGDIDQAQDPLLRSLLAQGLIRPDACRLGADVDEASRLVGADGRAGRSLFAVGPLTRGAFWEITSVPDIRSQAREVAQEIAGACARVPEPG